MNWLETVGQKYVEGVAWLAIMLPPVAVSRQVSEDAAPHLCVTTMKNENKNSVELNNEQNVNEGGTKMKANKRRLLLM